jgi:hypothetical protein
MCPHFHHPLWDTFATSFWFWLPLKQLVQPLMHHYSNTNVQLCYNYNTTTYNLIRIHIHQLFISSSYVLHFERFKKLWENYFKNNLWSAKKRSNEKITKRSISFPTYKILFIFSFSLWTFLFLNLITFLFVIHFKRFKVL